MSSTAGPASHIWVNLPVKDLERSVAFFTALGFTFNPAFTNNKGTCMIVGENISAMLLVEKFFATFATKTIADAKQCTEVILCLSLGSRAEVDAMVARALAAGGTAPTPAKDHGFMYGHGFEDLDGHVWELIHMPSEPPM